MTVDAPERAADLVGRLPAVRSATVVDGRLRVAVDPREAATVNRLLVENGLEVSELHRRVLSLEDVFFELVEDHPPTGPERVEVRGR
ncbi:hypothetical protein NMG29_00385 [Streptomyces cocklensis]|nr:hypothetical protein [Actinacidiphila cocklensis]